MAHKNVSKIKIHARATYAVKLECAKLKIKIIERKMIVGD